LLRYLKKIFYNSVAVLRYIYNVDVETDRLLPASAKCARFLITDNKNVISKSIKHIFFRRYATNIGIFS
jgi:chorismate mutase